VAAHRSAVSTTSLAITPRTWVLIQPGRSAARGG
jgi:hypothetical protein